MKLLTDSADVVALTREICDIESVSGNERALADAVETWIRETPHLDFFRDGDAFVARTNLGRAHRVLVAGHLDTVPVNNNLPTHLSDDGSELWGRGTVDMKGGVAVMVRLMRDLVEPVHDITWVFYDHEEVAADLNGLARLARIRPELLAADFAILGEPTNAIIEGGCNGTMRVRITTRGVRAHSARAWMGVNAIHGAADVLNRLNAYEPETVTVDGLDYREGINAVSIHGGIAGNVIPDECVIEINFRFAPSRSEADALAYLSRMFDGYELVVTDSSAGARPGADSPLAQSFIASVGGEIAPKYGWTDVARFTALGIPAVNYGPGNPSLAHADNEHVPLADLHACERGLRSWLTGV